MSGLVTQLARRYVSSRDGTAFDGLCRVSLCEFRGSDSAPGGLGCCQSMPEIRPTSNGRERLCGFGGRVIDVVDRWMPRPESAKVCVFDSRATSAGYWSRWKYGYR
jgi:hypothetical protein